MITQWKIWGVIGGAVLFALAFLKYRGDYHAAKREVAEKKAATAEKRHEHSDAVGRADRQAREEGRKKSREAAAKARSGDRTHFE